VTFTSGLVNLYTFPEFTLLATVQDHDK
jgi:hypothetical protein